MKLYLVRHGEAASESVDPQRPLTKRGREDVTKLAGFLKTLDISVSIIWHSGKTRAAQTAEIMSTVVNSGKGTVERQGLAPNDPVEDLAAEIETMSEDTMIVGHLPFLSKLTSLLTTGSTQEVLGFNESTIACLECDLQGKWWVTWMLYPEVL